MIILIHTSKTMRQVAGKAVTVPKLQADAARLAAYIKTLSSTQIATIMKVSPALAVKTKQIFMDWSDSNNLTPAIDSFIGDIYSGLQARVFSEDDLLYANEHLRILSGLYGILKPSDGVSPYRLEMGYKLPKSEYESLYDYWGDKIAKTLPSHGPIINLAAVEYSKTITPFIDESRIVSPRFLTRQPTGESTFVVVHAKIARGTFARWMIQSKVASVDRLHEFDQIGYRYEPGLSTEKEPVFICDVFGGKGLSVRLG